MSACYRGYQHDFVAILKGVGVPAEKTDVFIVDVDIDKAAELAGIVLDLRGQGRKIGVNIRNQRGQIGGVGG